VSLNLAHPVYLFWDVVLDHWSLVFLKDKIVYDLFIILKYLLIYNIIIRVVTNAEILVA